MEAAGARAAIKSAASNAGISINIDVEGNANKNGTLTSWSPASGTLKDGDTITLYFEEQTNEEQSNEGQNQNQSDNN